MGRSQDALDLLSLRQRFVLFEKPQLRAILTIKLLKLLEPRVPSAAILVRSDPLQSHRRNPW